MEQLPSLKQLLKHLQQMPYLASKNLYRVVNHFLLMDDVKMEQFCVAIVTAKRNIIKCNKCFMWKEKNLQCIFCDSTKRDQGIICVVETWQELLAIEKTGGYPGVYHVLGGSISPLEGIGPEDLTFDQLVKRVKDDSNIKEIILAMNQNPEGEATSSYISHKLKGLPITITCLARGVQVGSSLEFVDRVTLYKALSERRPF